MGRRAFGSSIHEMWPAPAVIREEAERPPLTPFGVRLRTLRKAKGFTQAVLGGRMGISQQTIAMLERGHRVPSMRMLERLCMGLNVSASDLLAPTSLDASPTLWAELDDALTDIEACLQRLRTITSAIAQKSAEAPELSGELSDDD